MRKLIIAAGLAAALVAPSAAMADTSTTFDSFKLGSPDGQSDWRMTAEQNINVVGDGIPKMGQSLNISNSIGVSDFFGALHSPALTNPVRTDATGPTKTFDASFSFYAPKGEQQGMAFSATPNDYNEGRMSYLRFQDEAKGVGVWFDDTNSDGSFNEREIATLSRGAVHQVRFLVTVKPKADDVKVFIDQKQVMTGTTWEGYYANNGWKPEFIDRMMFRVRDTGPATNPGYMIDNVVVKSS